MVFDTIRENGRASPVAELRSALDTVLDDVTRPRITVGRRDGTVTVYYRTLPNENEGPGRPRMLTVIEVVAGALVGPTTPDEVTFIAVAPGCEAWTVTADDGEAILRGERSREEFFERLDETQRTVEIDEPAESGVGRGFNNTTR